MSLPLSGSPHSKGEGQGLPGLGRLGSELVGFFCSWPLTSSVKLASESHPNVAWLEVPFPGTATF